MSDNNEGASQSGEENKGGPSEAEPKKLTSCEHESERRTAGFLARRIGDVQDQLYDLMADMRTFEHYSEIEDIGWCLMVAQRLKRKYRKFAQDGRWPED